MPRCCLPLLSTVFLAACEPTPAPAPVAPPVLSVNQLIASESGVFELRFSQLIQDVSGTQILAVDEDDPVARSVLDAIGTVAGEVMAEMNAPGSPVKDLRRINEASRLFEDALLRRLQATAGLSASIPRTAGGAAQRSGYPDIRVMHQASGRIFYLDPKLYETTSEHSSLRSFYFTPRRKTNKVLDDACHLLLGIAHDGNDGDWRFLDWKLIDLSRLTVRLKPEFQASNRDLYVPEATIRSGKVPD